MSNNNIKNEDGNNILTHQHPEGDVKKEETRVESENEIKDVNIELEEEQEQLITSFKNCALKESQEHFRVKENKSEEEKDSDNTMGSPIIFCGDGDSKTMGSVNKSVLTEHGTINSACDSPSSTPPEVQHENKDRDKYELARQLNNHIDKFRKEWTRDMSDDDEGVRQQAVALYLMDLLALRPGNKSGEGVGCYTLCVEHVKLVEATDNTYTVSFDFIGKCNIKYDRTVEVTKTVYDNLHLFVKNKKPEKYVFDKLDMGQINKYLKKNMVKLTAKVFRTHRASTTFETELFKTDVSQTVEGKVSSYTFANEVVADLLNHKKTSGDEMILGTTNSKLYYNDPRISVAWCKRNGVPIDKIYTKTLQEKFKWAIDTTNEDFKFSSVEGHKKEAVSPKKEETHMDVKWTFLQHNGPLFAPPYERLPDTVNLIYDGRRIKLTKESEEIATLYAKINRKYTSMKTFNENFFDDWKKAMTEEERLTITSLEKCGFEEMHKYFKTLKKNSKKETDSKYGYCDIDHVKRQIKNYKIGPSSLFHGNQLMGSVKRRLLPEDVTINCSRDSTPPTPPAGTNWKEVKHEPTVTWLARWKDSVTKKYIYVTLIG